VTVGAAVSATRSSEVHRGPRGPTSRRPIVVPATERRKRAQRQQRFGGQSPQLRVGLLERARRKSGSHLRARRLRQVGQLHQLAIDGSAGLAVAVSAAAASSIEMSRVRLASQRAFVRERPRRAAVERMSKASILAVVNGRSLVDDLQTIRGQWHRRSPPAATRPCVHRVADLLIKRPVVNAQLVSDQLNVAIDNVYRYLEPLVEAKIIVGSTDQARNRAWRAPEVLDALDAFAERAGRRSQLS
jgi:hypothetical protein